MPEYKKRTTSLLSCLTHHKAITPMLAEIKVATQIRSVWRNSLKGLAKKSQLSHIKSGIAVIQVNSAALKQEFMHVKNMVLSRLNTAAGTYSITDIKLVVAPIKQPQSAKTKQPSISFEQAIISENKRKKENGQTYCTNCQHILCATEICVFCKTTQDGV